MTNTNLFTSKQVAEYLQEVVENYYQPNTIIELPELIDDIEEFLSDSVVTYSEANQLLFNYGITQAVNNAIELGYSLDSFANGFSIDLVTTLLINQVNVLVIELFGDLDQLNYKELMNKLNKIK